MYSPDQRKIPRCRQATRDSNSNHHQVVPASQNTTTTTEAAVERMAFVNAIAGYALTILFLPELIASFL